MLLVLKACVGVIGNHKQEKRDEAILSVNKGSAQILVFGEENSKEAADSQILLEGDSVSTAGNSWVTLTFHNGTRVIMDSNTNLSFSSYALDDFDEHVTLNLSSGRVWLDPLANEQGTFDLEVKTKAMNVISSNGPGQALIANLANGELVYSIDGQVAIEFVDRGMEDAVIEQILLGKGSKTILDDDTQRALIERENVTLYEPSADDLADDAFVLWVNGNTSVSAVEEEEEEVEEVEIPVEEESEEPEEPIEGISAEPIKIRIDSPSSPSTIQKDAIAIEGSIVGGEASRVTVTWSGDGNAYDLGLFEAGSANFRYVADVEYANFAVGENTYTIRAYDADGNVSNVLTVVLTGEF